MIPSLPSAVVQTVNAPLSEAAGLLLDAATLMERAGRLIREGVRCIPHSKPFISPDEQPHQRIIRHTAEVFGCSVTQLRAHSNHREVVQPRQVAAYLLRTDLLLSTPQIGRILGAFHHSTMIYAIRRVEAQCAASESYRAIVEAIRKACEAKNE